MTTQISVIPRARPRVARVRVARYLARMNEHVPPSKFRRYRERKRAAGLRELRMWVPDLRSPVWQAALAGEAASIAHEASRQPTDDEAAWDRHIDLEMASWDDWTV